MIERTLAEYHKNSVENEKIIEKIMKLRKRLSDVSCMHESLLSDKIRVQNLMSKAIENVIVNAFSTSVNFEREFLNEVVQKNADIDVLKKILNPLKSVKKSVSFNPIRAFLEQRLISQAEETREEQLLDVDLEEMDRKREELEYQQQLEREKRLERYLIMLLEPLVEQHEVKLSSILSSIEQKDEGAYKEIANPLFYMLIIQLHQMGTVQLLNQFEAGHLVLADIPRAIVKVATDRKDIHELKSFEIIAVDGKIQFSDGSVMSDFLIVRKTR